MLITVPAGRAAAFKETHQLGVRTDVNVPKRSTNTTAKVRDTTLLDWAMIRHAEGLRAPFEGVLIG